MKKLKITIGDVEVKAKLLTEKAPNTIKIFESVEKDLVGKLNHAKVCDNELFFQSPVFIDEKENPVYPVAGDIGYWTVRQTICIWYGKMKPLGPTNLFAQIEPGDLPKFAAEAKKVWNKQGALIKFEFIEEE